MPAPIRLVVTTAVALALSGCSAKRLLLVPATATQPARGDVKISATLNGDTKVEVETRHLIPPERLDPPRLTYVVWIRPPAGKPLNLGEVTLGKDQTGRFRSVTKHRTFVLFVTAENDAFAKAPTGEEIMHALVDRTFKP